MYHITMKKEMGVNLQAIAQEAMVKYGFSPVFSKEIIREAEEIAQKKVSDDENSLDLGDLLWSSIDNYDSLDLDQIAYCAPGNSGDIHIKVAIADVDFFVRKNSLTDRHASHNGTSVYTGIEIFPMLPNILSQNASSLLPGLNHSAIIIEYVVTSDGKTQPGNIYRAKVRNKAKLIYEEVGDWLEGKSAIPESILSVPGLSEQILLQKIAAERLRKERRKNGALDLGTLESSAVFQNGEVIDITIQDQNIARIIIEEFMVAANGTIVHFLVNAQKAMIQRIVRRPKNWDGIRIIASQFHYKLPKKPDSKALADFLIRQRNRDPERFPDLSITMVKLIGPGEYVCLAQNDDPVGHFALAVTDYTHGTAPNRRFVDLIIQRIIKSVLDKKQNPYSEEELIELASWLSGREKGSKKVERFMQKAAAAVLLQNSIGKMFEGFITGSSEKGVYVRILSPPVEGKIMAGCRGLYVGQKVRVRLIHVDPLYGYIDFDCSGRIDQKLQGY